MIYILTGIVIFAVVYQYKRHLLKVLRTIGFFYLAVAVLEGISGGNIIPIFVSGLGLYDAVVHLALGVGFVVFGTKEIRNPPDDIIEDDLNNEEYNPLTH